MIRSLESFNADSEFPLPDVGLDVPGPSSGGLLSQPLFGTVDVVELPENLRLQIGPLTRSNPDSSVVDPVRRDLIRLPSASPTLPNAQVFSFGRTIQPGSRTAPSPPSTTIHSGLSVLPSLRLPIIPRAFHAPLSFSCPENFQVTGETDFEMSLYAFLIASLLG